MILLGEKLVSQRHTRRHWLQIGALGPVGLSLAQVLEAQAIGNSSATPRSCVLFVLHGGPSQLDTWDMKPAAPAEVRGEFRPIATSVPGVHIVEHLPRLARLGHLFSIVRSMHHTMINHNAATYIVTTGNPPLREQIAFTPTENDFPHLGAQLAFALPGRGLVPTAVTLPDPVSDGPYTCPGQNGGFLGATYAPFAIHGDPNADDFTVEGLVSDVGADRLRGRQTLLRSMDSFLGRLNDERRLDELDRYQRRAFELLASPATRQAFDLAGEPQRVRERYGRHKYGQSLLLARRLVEAGVRLVTVYWGGRVNNPDPHWDTHFNNNRRLKDDLLPPFDQCFSAFLQDLAERGMLENTLVICTGEFGRTPRFGQFTGNGVNETGRDHWAACYSLLLAGGRLGGGRILGRSDRFAAYPAEEPYTPQDLAATVLHSLGVNPTRHVRDAFLREVPLSEGQVRPHFFG
ncbi:MAG: DUF1501 domain-containing protein [Gemmataceae bacterium]|nr:DUF1501 domain-containing protein [Gemmataceae bacterium]MCI0739242.1 DUF1501 domain-containing protein [Gemmataceae bacterium]